MTSSNNKLKFCFKSLKRQTSYFIYYLQKSFNNTSAKSRVETIENLCNLNSPVARLTDLEKAISALYSFATGTKLGCYIALFDFL